MLGNNKKSGYRERIKHSQAKIVKGKLKEMSFLFSIYIHIILNQAIYTNFL